MIKQAILFVGLMASGSGLLGLAAGTFSPSLKVSANVPAEISPRVVDRPLEIVTAAELPRAPAARQPAKKRVVRSVTLAAVAAPPASGRPCTQWRDVGAIYRADRGATGVHRVRALCF